jgi:hypothetical protein
LASACAGPLIENLLLSPAKTQPPGIIPEVLDISKAEGLGHCFFDGNGDGDRGTDHGVVTHTDESHHFYVCGNRGRSGELSAGVHPSHGVGHIIGGRTGGNIVGVQCLSCSSTGGDGKEIFSLLIAFFLVDTCRGVLDSGGVGGVPCDGNSQCSLIIVKFCFNIVKTIDPGDQISRVLTKTVKDDPQGFVLTVLAF